MTSPFEMTLDDVPAEVNAVTAQILAAAIEVHTVLGAGLLERVYLLCMVRELEASGHSCRSEVVAPVVYKGGRIEAGYRFDLLVDEQVLVEVKEVERLPRSTPPKS